MLESSAEDSPAVQRALARRLRAVRWLALRSPALYKDAQWNAPKLDLHLDADLPAYRRRHIAAQDNRTIVAGDDFGRLHFLRLVEPELRTQNRWTSRVVTRRTIHRACDDVISDRLTLSFVVGLRDRR